MLVKHRNELSITKFLVLLLYPAGIYVYNGIFGIKIEPLDGLILLLEYFMNTSLKLKNELFSSF